MTGIFHSLKKVYETVGWMFQTLARALETNLIWPEVGHCYILKDSDGSTTLRHGFTGLSCVPAPDVVGPPGVEVEQLHQEELQHVRRHSYRLRRRSLEWPEVRRRRDRRVVACWHCWRSFASTE